ncbi:MAG: hypothetical protein M1416_01510 [Candidatus Pacearchaeota archaeon]|nr:hypothetical protein [Candidatus Pacearchaeota archaeon]
MEKLEITIKKDELAKCYKFDLDMGYAVYKDMKFGEAGIKCGLGGYMLLGEVMQEYTNSKIKNKKDKYEVFPINLEELKDSFIKEININGNPRILDFVQLNTFRMTGVLYLGNNKFIAADYSKKFKRSKGKIKLE